MRKLDSGRAWNKKSHLLSQLPTGFLTHRQLFEGDPAGRWPAPHDRAESGHESPARALHSPCSIASLGMYSVQADRGAECIAHIDPSVMFMSASHLAAAKTSAVRLDGAGAHKICIGWRRAPELVDKVDLVLDLPRVRVDARRDDALIHDVSAAETAIRQDIQQHVRGDRVLREDLREIWRWYGSALVTVVSEWTCQAQRGAWTCICQRRLALEQHCQLRFTRSHADTIVLCGCRRSTNCAGPRSLTRKVHGDVHTSLCVLYSACPASEHLRSSGTTSVSRRPITFCAAQSKFRYRISRYDISTVR